MTAAKERRRSFQSGETDGHGAGGGGGGGGDGRQDGGGLDMAALEEVGRMMREDAARKTSRLSRPPPLNLDLNSSTMSNRSNGNINDNGKRRVSNDNGKMRMSGLSDSGNGISPALIFGARTRRLSQESGVLPTPTSISSSSSKLFVALPPVRIDGHQRKTTRNLTDGSHTSSRQMRRQPSTTSMPHAAAAPT